MPGANQADVRVRMYRQGLGDCFLLSFPGKQRSVHMLIDCGAFPSKHYGDAEMRRVVEDIKTTTDGHLDVLMVTHEHWDHISGFTQARDIFDQIDIGEVWVGWTEDPSRPGAKVLKDRFQKKKKAVEMALGRISDHNKSAELTMYRGAITHLFGFFGGLGANGGAGKVADAWDYILKKGTKVYCDPTRPPLALRDLEGVRVYVLGPPEDPDYVKKLLSKKETYDTGFNSLSLADSFLAAVDAGADPELQKRALPFDARYALSEGEAKKHDFFRRHYGFDENADGAWQHIDDDWLTVAGELALQLDSYTNNTCLAIAIELVESGKVLLFPGDAQVGNWLSWGDRSWSVDEPGGSTKTVTIDDLLSRTVLYKVGHHGSHNATLRARGLEKMASGDLVAMVPVHRKTAEDQDWKFPYEPLWIRLREKAGGRVVLADDEELEGLEQEISSRLSAAEWKRFKKAIRSEPLYVDYSISG